MRILMKSLSVSSATAVPVVPVVAYGSKARRASGSDRVRHDNKRKSIECVYGFVFYGPHGAISVVMRACSMF